jgi:hypothetical protein
VLLENISRLAGMHDTLLAASKGCAAAWIFMPLKGFDKDSH